MLPTTSLKYPVDLALPNLPSALEGLRIAHVTDLHIRGPRPRFARVAWLLATLRLDLIVFTGDYMEKKGDEQAAVTVLEQLCRQARPRLGMFGVFGNHDLRGFRDDCRQLPIHWLNGQTHRPEGLPLEIWGVDTDGNNHFEVVSLLLERGSTVASAQPGSVKGDKRPLRLLLTHLPTALPAASDLDVDLVLCGHTHGGQCRILPGFPLINSLDWPLGLTSGLLRHRQTLCAVSRGLGETGFAKIRTFCRPHLPVYTLRRGSLPGELSDLAQNVQPW